MSSTAEECRREVLDVLNKHGVGTYIVVLKCPDSDLEARAVGGSNAWITGHATFLADLMTRRYNDDLQQFQDEP